MQTKNIIIGVLVLALLASLAYLYTNHQKDVVVENTNTTTEEPIPVEPDGGIGDGAEPLSELLAEERGPQSNIGASVDGNNITAYHFGSGETELLFIGGIHGGYSWGTTLVAQELISYLQSNPGSIPENVSVTVIPVANPDGLATTLNGETLSANTSATDVARITGRFNANNVDLNRNFDCEWEEEGVWREQTVSGGLAAFSEPEAQAIRDYVTEYNPAAAVVWFGAEGKVYPSACSGAASKDAITLAATYANSAGYPVAAEFDAYAITGDMVNWLAKENIPAISVLLSNHTEPEFDKNLAGIEAILNAYAE